MTYDVEARLRQAAADAEARIANCHTVVACPACGVPRGERCVRRGTSSEASVWAPRLKHPHRERWTMVVPAR